MKKIGFIVALYMVLTLLSCNEKEQNKYYLYALMAYHEKDFEKSLVNVEKISFFDGQYAEGQFLKGKILFFQNDYTRAEDIFEKLWVKKFGYESLIWQIRSLVLANSLDKAEKILLREIQRGSTDWRVFYYLSKIYKKQNKTEESILNLQYAEISLQEGKKVFDDLLLFWNEVQVLEKVEKYKAKKQCLEL